MAAIIRMIATTISNSINENPLLLSHALPPPGKLCQESLPVVLHLDFKDRICLSCAHEYRLMKQWEV